MADAATLGDLVLLTHGETLSAGVNWEEVRRGAGAKILRRKSVSRQSELP